MVKHRQLKQDIADAIGRRIEMLRRDRGMTQAALAELVGCCPQNVSRMEAGCYLPRLDTLALYADALGVSMSSLVRSADTIVMQDLS